MPDGLVIRKLRPEDVPRFFSPDNQALGEKWLQQQKRDEMYVAVAEIDGVAVGRSSLLYNFKGDPPNAYSFASTVSDEWQSHGIGSALVAHNERVARSRGMYHISAHASTDNPRSAAWRERMGYRRVGEETIHWDEADGRHVESRSWKYERSFTPPASYRIRRWLRKRNMGARFWTLANGIMLVMFLFSAAVQFNDPDPLIWISIYGAGAAVCALEIRHRASPLAAGALALIALIWAGSLYFRAHDVPISSLFAEWEMRDLRVEEAREMYGLTIVAVWMIVIASIGWRRVKS